MNRNSRPAESAAQRLDQNALRLLTLRFFVLLAALAVIGCSGSGSDSSPTSPQLLDVATVESQSFELVNRARDDAGVGLLAFDAELSRIAREHSEQMRDRGFFSHKDPEGDGLRSRLKAHGVAFSAAGENLALVNDTGNPAGLAHQQLLDSPEHRDVMLAGRFVRGGVGVAQSGSSYWITQIFLKP